MVREMTLAVESDFEDAWLERLASVPERTAVLRFACGLPREVKKLDRQEMARVVETAVAAAANASHATELGALQEQVRTLQRAVVELETQLRHEQVQAANAAHVTQDQLDLAKRRAVEEARQQTESAYLVLRDKHDKVCADRLETEQRLAAQVREQLAELLRTSKECNELRVKVDELQTPAGRGRTAEYAVLDALTEAGFAVEDTSMGSAKEAGHMDLLLRHEELRVAIEIKNRAKIDPQKDTVAFEERARAGIAQGLFDTAIFVSLRVHHKRPAPQHLEMLEDADGRPTVPVSFLGPERGRDAPPVTQEGLVSHVCMHVAFALRCRILRELWTQRDAAATDDDAHVTRIKELVERVGTDVAETLEQMNQQAKLVAGWQQSIKSVRVRVMQLLSVLGDVGRSVPWLRRTHADPVWMPEYQLVRDKVAHGVTDALLWKNLSEPQKKRINDHLGGRETVLKAAHTDPRGKRARTEEETGQEDGEPVC